jgi:hypothetical protein
MKLRRVERSSSRPSEAIELSSGVYHGNTKSMIFHVPHCKYYNCKSQCPTEFGHKISVVTGKSGLITQYEVLNGNPSDGSTPERILDNHIRQYDRAPRHFSADRRYYIAKNKELLGKRGVKRVSIKKPGYRSKT